MSVYTSCLRLEKSKELIEKQGRKNLTYIHLKSEIPLPYWHHKGQFWALTCIFMGFQRFQGKLIFQWALVQTGCNIVLQQTYKPAVFGISEHVSTSSIALIPVIILPYHMKRRSPFKFPLRPSTFHWSLHTNRSLWESWCSPRRSWFVHLTVNYVLQTVHCVGVGRHCGCVLWLEMVVVVAVVVVVVAGCCGYGWLWLWWRLFWLR